MDTFLQIVGLFTVITAGLFLLYVTLLKTDKKNIDKAKIRQFIIDNHPDIIKLELKKFEEINSVEKQYEDYQYDKATIGNIQNSINEKYNKLINESINSILKSSKEMTFIYSLHKRKANS